MSCGDTYVEESKIWGTKSQCVNVFVTDANSLSQWIAHVMYKASDTVTSAVCYVYASKITDKNKRWKSIEIMIHTVYGHQFETVIGQHGMKLTLDPEPSYFIKALTKTSFKTNETAAKILLNLICVWLVVKKAGKESYIIIQAPEQIGKHKMYKAHIRETTADTTMSV